MSAATAVLSGSDVSNRVAVEQCPEGHMLQASSADAGRCEGCDRWIFPKEKVMSCGSCSCHYCSTCAPQVRTSPDDNMWEDILSTIGSAFRDVERVKTQITSEIDVDFQRIRSAFNCQAAGQETLSADQIVVEHVYEQAKTVLSCSAPDAADLASQEEVFDEVVERRNPAELDTAESPQESEVLTAKPEKAPMDLLDLTAPVESSSQEAPMDLLDFSDPVVDEGKASVEVPDLLLVGAAELQEDADLPSMQKSNPLDSVEPMLGGSSTDTSPPQAVHKPVDLLDLSEQPLSSHVATGIDVR